MPKQPSVVRPEPKIADYHYEKIAESLPLVSTVKNPKEGEKARTIIGAIVIRQKGSWRYW